MVDTAKVSQGIESLVNAWSARLAALPADAAHSRPTEDRWAISEVIGHLVDSACNNHQRFVRAQALPSLEFPKYEQNAWVFAANYRAMDWETLISLWCSYNRMLAVLIRNIPDACLDTRCTITPYEACTLGFLIEDYLTHLEHHLGILGDRISERESP